MVDHILARCKWAERLGADDIAEARGVERALRGANLRLQAHHVYMLALNRSKRRSSQPTTGRVASHQLFTTHERTTDGPRCIVRMRCRSLHVQHF